MQATSLIPDRRAEILALMRAAAIAAGRDPATITLVAVSKTQPDAAIEAMLASGQCVFGENRVQEALTRWEECRLTIQNLTLHLIGPLQTNKAQEAVRMFDVIESVDRPKLARALANAIQKTGRAPEMLVQVNTGEEAQKAGIAPHAVDDFLKALRQDYDITPQGLMCIPPLGEHPGAHFALLAKIAARNGLARLSMGMSDDFEIAIRFGATHVRVGTALFGPRTHSDTALSLENEAPSSPKE